MLSYCIVFVCCSLCFFFNDTATTEIYTLSLHDALPISTERGPGSMTAISEGAWRARMASSRLRTTAMRRTGKPRRRSEEHTSELQSRQYLVCRLLLEKKKQKKMFRYHRDHNNEVICT